MKFFGNLVGQDVVVLVDNGASHNFLSTQVVQWLQLLMIATPSFKVKLGVG